MELTIKTMIKEGFPLSEQTQVFQAWFNEHIIPNVDFVDTCTVRDEWQRPLEWHLPEVRVVAEYHTKDINYNFNQFKIYGNSIY